MNLSVVFESSSCHGLRMHILFVCWGNICRSPAAEATFRKVVKKEGLCEKITIDSAEPYQLIKEILPTPE